MKDTTPVEVIIQYWLVFLQKNSYQTNDFMSIVKALKIFKVEL
jgi:hypothetical protein